jgi:hypothetical protein
VPSSLIIVALVVAWLMILVPMIARRRQEVAKTADSALAARVVRSGSTRTVAEEEYHVADQVQAEADRAEERHAREARPRTRQEVEVEESDDAAYQPREYRAGRGGFNPQAAVESARARYAFRQRVVLFLLFVAVASGLVAGFAMPVVWWGHAATDLVLVSYLTYLRRQVRIEEEIRQRRMARIAAVRRKQQAEAEAAVAETGPMPAVGEEDARVTRIGNATPHRTRPTTPGVVVVEIDDEDPAFEELESVHRLPYRRAAGE